MDPFENMEPDPTFWTYEDQSNLDYLELRYADRKKLGEEAISKRKALKDIASDNPFYQRAAMSAELAAMRWDMAYIVAENKKLRMMIGTIDWLHTQVNILMGAYSHVKMLAEKCRIDYGLINSGLTQIIKLKEEIQGGADKSKT